MILKEELEEEIKLYPYSIIAALESTDKGRQALKKCAVVANNWRECTEIITLGGEDEETRKNDVATSQSQ